MHCIGQFLHFGGRFPRQINDQNSGESTVGFALHKKTIFELFGVLGSTFQDVAVYQLNGVGLVFERNQRGAQGIVNAVKVGAHQPRRLGRQRHEIEFYFAQKTQRPLRPRNELAHIESRRAAKRSRVEQHIQGVARVSSFN